MMGIHCRKYRHGKTKHFLLTKAGSPYACKLYNNTVQNPHGEQHQNSGKGNGFPVFLLKKEQKNIQRYRQQNGVMPKRGGKKAHCGKAEAIVPFVQPGTFGLIDLDDLREDNQYHDG